MMKGCLPSALAAARTASMSAAVSTNDWLTASTPCSSANSRQARSWSVNALMPRSMPGRLRPFRERSSPPTATLQCTSLPATRSTTSCTRPSLRKSRSPGFTTWGSRSKLIETRCGVADDVLAGQREAVAGAQLDRLRLDLADAHLGAGQVGHDGDAPAGGLLRGADAGDALGVAGEVAVREVEPRDVQPRADEALQHLRRFRGRADGGDDLGLVGGKLHGRRLSHARAPTRRQRRSRHGSAPLRLSAG